MGNCCGLFGNDQNGYQEHRTDQQHQSPDRVALRELQAQAAEKRLRENAHKGIKDIEAVKRQQAKRDQRENLEAANTVEGGGLKWNVNN